MTDKEILRQIKYQLKEIKKQLDQMMKDVEGTIDMTSELQIRKAGKK